MRGPWLPALAATADRRHDHEHDRSWHARGRKAPVRVLHLFANWKWTGPAEPALNLAWRQSREHEVVFLSGQPPEGQGSRIVPQAEARGVAMRGGFQLGKHARLRRN